MNAVIDFLLQGGCVITANNRLSRDLVGQYHAYQEAQGRQIWETPEVMPWSAWLIKLRGLLIDSDSVLLNAQQETLLWEQVIAESNYSDRLLMKAAAARGARQAWLLLHQYQACFPFQTSWLHEDAQAFSDWAKAYTRLTTAQAWQDEARLPDQLLKNVDAVSRCLQSPVALAGFIRLNPQQQSLIEALRGSGIEIRMLNGETQTSEPACESYQNSEAELQAAARWARQQIERNPDGRYAVVMPKLEAVRDRLQDIFDDVLLPSSWQPDRSHSPRPYNISAGHSLAEYAPIVTAFGILELSPGEFSLQSLSSLLRSVFIRSYATESGQRALFDAALRDHGEMTLRLNDLHYLAGNSNSAGQISCPAFLSSLDNWQQLYRSLPRTQSAAAWAESISALLECFGWPGDRPLDSHEYQGLKAWQQCLQDLCRLSLVSKPMSIRRALGLLRRLAEAQMFQPASENPPLQVIGLLEASGQRFDGLRVCGLHDEQWPPALSPNAFIPMSVQREYDMPHASAQREYEYAMTLTEGLLQSAPQVILSYPRQQGDRDLRISPLLAEYPIQHCTTDSGTYQDWRKRLLSVQGLQAWSDEQAPVLPGGERVTGGTALFQDQAACPFRAFARHRLRARPLASVANGLDPMQRGNLVHQCLEALWQSLRDQSRLLQLDEAELQGVIDAAVLQVIEQNSVGHQTTYSSRFKELEQARLASLMREWLEQEKTRAPFSVKETEQSHVIRIANIEVNTKIDRIDELTDGSRVVIDYKTGQPNPSAWFGARPDEPQLPIYASADDASLAAVSFAQVRRGEMGWKGIARDQNILPGVKHPVSKYTDEIEDFSALGNYWQGILNQLAENYRAGNAEVDPKDENSCNYCPLDSLCRIDNSRGDDDE